MPLSLVFASMREEVPQHARLRESADALEGPRPFVGRRRHHGEVTDQLCRIPP